MTLRRCWSGTFCATLVLLAGVAPGVLFSAPALGQNLPQDLLAANQPLSAAQINLLTTSYIKPWVRTLLESQEDEKVAEARGRLTEPLSSASVFFIAGYSSGLAGELIDARALSRDRRTMVRLSAMIVASHLQTSSVTRLIAEGLADTSPATRYWAGKAVQRLGEAQAATPGLLNANELTSLVDLVVRAVNQEPVQAVVEQLLTGLGRLGGTQAADQLMGVLIQRVSVHASDPNLPIAAEMQALLDQFQQLVRIDNRPRDVVRKLMLAAFKYLELSAQMVERGGLDINTRGDYARLVELCDQVLFWAAGELKVGGELPRSVKGLSPAEAKLQIEVWRTILQGAPLNFTREQVAPGGQAPTVPATP